MKKRNVFLKNALLIIHTQTFNALLRMDMYIDTYKVSVYIGSENGFLEEVSITHIDKTDGSDTTKR